MPKKPTLPATAQLRVPIELIERMFRLTRDKLNRSQFVTGTQKHRDPRYPPYAFTEYGVAKMEHIEATQRQHTSIITSVIEEIRKLKQAPALKPKRRIGFTAE